MASGFSRTWNWRCDVKVRTGGRPRSSSLCLLAFLPLFVLAGATRTGGADQGLCGAAERRTLVTAIDTATGTVARHSPVGAGPREGGHHPRRHPRLRGQQRAPTPSR